MSFDINDYGDKLFVDNGSDAEKTKIAEYKKIKKL